jgi:hypothetical protein
MDRQRAGITTDPDALGYAFDPSVQTTVLHFLGLNSPQIHKFISFCNNIKIML